MDSATRACVARRRRNKERGREGENEREKESLIHTRAKRVLQICRPWHGRASERARGRESDPRRGWKSIAERKREIYRERGEGRGRARRAERERDGRRERGRGSTRRPRLRRSLSAGAVAGPSCPVPRSLCSPFSVSDPVVSHTNSARCIAVIARRHRRSHHRYICSDRKVLTP